MAVKFGFFNSENGDRLYNAEDIGNYFVKLISDGVFATPATSLQVQESTGMTISIAEGWGFIACHWLNNTSAYNLTLGSSSPTVDRIDRIVLRLDRANRRMQLVLLTGIPSASPTAPSLTRTTNGIYELSLAQIYVSAGAVAITQADITDERADTSLCGYVTGLIDQIDTTNLFAQYNAAFNDFLSAARTGLNYNNLVAQYVYNYFTSAASESSITIPIQDYNYALDILEVYQDGVRLAEGVDYTKTATAITLTTAITTVNTMVTFVCFKSIDTTSAASVTVEVVALQNEVNAVSQAQGGISWVQCTQAEYNAMQSHDANTLYLVLPS